LSELLEWHVNAIEQLDYLLGRNHFNQSFVTGVGSKPVQQVNHLFGHDAQKLTFQGFWSAVPTSMLRMKLRLSIKVC